MHLQQMINLLKHIISAVHAALNLPSWISFNDGAGDINSNSNIAGSSVSSTTKALFGNSEVMQITYSKGIVDGHAVGVNLNDSVNVDVNGKKVYLNGARIPRLL